MIYPLIPKGEEKIARAAMPKTPHGYVIALQYVPAQYRQAYEDAWRLWTQAYPSRLWPDWLCAWIEQKQKSVRAGIST
jgi:hypothetical protein